VDLIGDVRDEPEVVPLDHDIVAGRKLVSDSAQPRGRLLPGERDLLLQLHQFHVRLHSSAAIPCPLPNREMIRGQITPRG